MMRLLDNYLPVFKQVLLMTGDPESFPGYEQNRRCCVTLLEQAILDAGQLDISEQEKEAARVAVIAWLDETILRSVLPWRQRWQSELLQRRYLNLTIAGERFFTILEQLDPQYDQAREVFLFCLLYGFQGQYSTPDDKTALQAVIAEQRGLCLPDAWQEWPNEAEITSRPSVQPTSISQRLSPLFMLIIGVSLLYGSLFFLLSHYVS